MADAQQSVRIKSGIAGLDNMLFGGIPGGNQVLISGGPGSGKTLMCLEILYRNAKEGVPSLFISLEESADEVLNQFKSAFPDIPDVEQTISDKKLFVRSNETIFESSVDTERDLIGTFAKVTSDVEQLVKETGAKCVAIDSLTVLRLVSSDEGTLTYRRALLSLITSLRKQGVTALLTLEMPSTERSAMKFPTEFFLFDGIIILYQSESQEKRSFNLEIIKMRKTNHSFSFAPYEVTRRGFRVFAVEETAMY